MVFQHCKSVKLKWIEEALDILYNIQEIQVKTQVKRKTKRTRLREIPKLEDIVFHTVAINSCDMSWITKELGLNLRTAQHYTRMLSKLRWVIFGRWYPFYDPNPFLEHITYIFPQKIWKIVKKFAPLQVDLLDLFAMPLEFALQDEISDVDFRWSQVEPTFGISYFPNISLPNRRLYPYWSGIVQIKIEGKKKTYYVVLPYNIHWTGRNCHITLPIPFNFYGIESATYSKGELKVHFDNSVKTTIPLGSASYTTRSWLHKYKMKHWSDSVTRFMIKHWKNEYAECFDFKTHEQILRNRLINKTRLMNEIADRDFIIKQILQIRD